MEEDHKIINWCNEVHTYWCQFSCHIWWSSKTLKMSTESNFEQFWWLDVKIVINICEPHYANLFFVNLLHSPNVWLFNIWHLFDNLTSFWQLETLLKLKSAHPVTWATCRCLICLLVAKWLQILVEEVLSFEIWGVTSKSDNNELLKWGKCETTSIFYMIIVNFLISPNHLKSLIFVFQVYLIFHKFSLFKKNLNRFTPHGITSSHSPAVWLFDIWHPFDILTDYLNHSGPSQGLSWHLTHFWQFKYFDKSTHYLNDLILSHGYFWQIFCHFFRPTILLRNWELASIYLKSPIWGLGMIFHQISAFFSKKWIQTVLSYTLLPFCQKQNSILRKLEICFTFWVCISVGSDRDSDCRYKFRFLTKIFLFVSKLTSTS